MRCPTCKDVCYDVHVGKSFVFLDTVKNVVVDQTEEESEHSHYFCPVCNEDWDDEAVEP